MKRWEAAQNVLYKKSNAKYWSKEKRLDRSRENEKGETWDIAARESTLSPCRITVCKEMPSADLLAVCAISLVPGNRQYVAAWTRQYT
jgi:hypothetical protein